MGSNGFSSERKQKRVDLLKQLLNTNISTQGSSNPLEALLSGLDLGSLEDLMQKNKKSHHDDWDSKKKRHHDDCSDHDWDHKKKHDHDDCGCKKKKHDHNDWDHKKKHDHDDCGCKKKKHDHDDCGCKKKKRCKCCPDVTQEFREAINEICRLLNAGISTPADLAALKAALEVLEDLLLDNEDCIDEEIAEDLLELINIIQAAATVAAIPLGTLDELGRQLNKLRRCLGLRVRVCRPGGGGGGGDCTDCGADFNDIRNAINRVCAELRRNPNQFDLGDLQDDINDLVPFLDAPCISDAVRQLVTDTTDVVLGADTLQELPADALTDLSDSLIVLRECIGVNNPDAPPCVPQVTPGGGEGGAPIPSPITTIRQRLLDLLTEQVVITTPTAVFAGTVVTVQTDYVAIVNATGTALIPFDQIQTFTTE
ncbi:hypothetical protein [Priestia megaterium]|uniref:hypothetical protein n=1 Tax=Priestia megaterium TaxID=1404 RepID=UPI000BA6319F|nr:hypothetical protein [Priestia megaterium]PAK45955.1 hypothetical protein CHH47_24915 [Priestia megaterium]